MQDSRITTTIVLRMRVLPRSSRLNLTVRRPIFFPMTGHTKSPVYGARSRRKNGDVPARMSAAVSKSPATNQHDASEYHEELQSAYRALKACRSDSWSTRRDDLDQCPATVKTTLRRLELLMAMSELNKRRVLLLGDD